MEKTLLQSVWGLKTKFDNISIPQNDRFVLIDGITYHLNPIKKNCNCGYDHKYISKTKQKET